MHVTTVASLLVFGALVVACTRGFQTARVVAVKRFLHKR